MMQKILYLGLAGAVGTVMRHFLSVLVQKNLGGQFPLGTAVVNIFGCLMFGLIWALMENRFTIGGQLRMVIFVGFFGAFTTFSSFMFESVNLMNRSGWNWALGNCLLQNTLGLAAVLIGLMVGSFL
jgi:fluoride exporter